MAIFGGKPVRETPLSYGRQYIEGADITAVVETLKCDCLTVGPKIIEREKRLCQVTGAKYAVAVCNGTAALLLSRLDKLPVFSARRREIVAKYDAAFFQMSELFVQKEIPESDTTRHLYILRLRPGC